MDLRHQGIMYQSEEQRDVSLRVFLVQALRQRQKLILIADPLNGRANFAHLESNDIDLQHCVAEGQLRVLTVHQTFLRQGLFDPSKMSAWLRNEASRVQSEGYQALRVAADMTWVLLAATGLDRLLDYEIELNDITRHRNCMVLCQYDRRRLSSGVLQQVLAVHPTVTIGAEVYPNPYYQIAASRFGETPASGTTLGHWVPGVNVSGQVILP